MTLLRVVLVLAIASFAVDVASADDAKARLTVKRDQNTWIGRAANFYAYVNGHSVGTLTNGQESTFSFPVSSDGTYDIEVRDWTGFHDNSVIVSAKPDENIVLSVGTGFWGPNVREEYVEPLFPIQVFFETDRPTTVVVDDRVYSVSASGLIQLPQKTTVSGIVRVEYGGTTDGKRFPLFLTPGHSTVVDLSKAPTDFNKMISSEEFLYQMELARIFHFWSETPSVFDRADHFVADLKGIRTFGVGKALVDLRDAEIAWVNELEEIGDESLAWDAFVNFGGAALACGLECIVTRRAPSQATLFIESAQASYSTTSDAISRGKRLRELTSDIQAKREKVFEGLVVVDERINGMQMNVAVRDRQLQRHLLGEWTFVSPLDNLPYKYRFLSKGRLQQVVGTEVSDASYAVRGGQVIIRWPSGSEETAQCEINSESEMRYRITAHSGDYRQVGHEMVFFNPERKLQSDSKNKLTGAALLLMLKALAN